MSTLQGKIALVTGAGSGLGAAIARRLADDGATVIVNDLDVDAAATIAAEVGGSAAAFDVSDSSAFDAAVDAAADAHGSIDIVVNNAGILLDRPDLRQRQIAAMTAEMAGDPAPPIRALSSMSDADFDRMMKVHVYGTFNGVRAALRHMEPAGAGAIVNLASIYGLRGSPSTPAYAAAKHAIVGLTRSVGSEVARLGIRVNAVAPGFIDTPMLAPIGELKDMLVAQIPARRLGRAEEVAAAVRFLAGPESSYCVGEILPLTGGSGD